MSTAAAQQVLDATVRPALAAPVSVVSTDGRDHATVPPAALGAALTFTAKPDGTLAVGLDPAKLQAALGAGFVGFGTPARDASFAVSGGSIHVVPQDPQCQAVSHAAEPVVQLGEGLLVRAGHERDDRFIGEMGERAGHRNSLAHRR